MAERFVSTVKLSQDGAIYPAICTWYGALTFAQLADDKDLLQRLIGQFDAEFTPSLVNFALAKQHVDYLRFRCGSLADLFCPQMALST